MLEFKLIILIVLLKSFQSINTLSLSKHSDGKL